MRSMALAVLLVCGVCLRTWAEDDGPRQVLKERNLKQVGQMVVLIDETAVTKMLGEIPKYKKQLLDAGKARAAAEKAVAYRDTTLQRLRLQRQTLSTQLANVQNVEQNNRLVGMLTAVTDEISLLLDNDKPDEAAKLARNKANVVRELYVAHVLEMRKKYDEVLAEYETLAEDESIKELLAELGTEKPVKLGPSRTFQQADDRIKKIEGTILSETIPLHQEGGVWMTAVVVNGAEAEEFVVDTGAGIMSIPAPLAEKLKLIPTSTSPTIQLSVADGRTIEAKLVYAKSVRVGQFTVENVECAVLPESASTGAPPLLGQSFLGKFSFQLNSDAGELRITRIEGEDGSVKPVRKPKGKPDPGLKLKDEPDDKEE